MYWICNIIKRAWTKFICSGFFLAINTQLLYNFYISGGVILIKNEEENVQKLERYLKEREKINIDIVKIIKK